MEVVIGLLLMLLRVSHGVEPYCDGRQDGAQCYGALGGTVILQLMDSASEIFRYQLLKNTMAILDGRKNRIVAIAYRSSFTPSDGTFRINNLSRTDGGEYTLKTFDSKGRRSEQRTLQLMIQAPVSSVLLVSECLSQGEMRVSCSSEGGDSPQYSWTLDGHTLTDTQLLSGNNETNIITLKQDVSGQLVCSVKNHVSSVSETKTISTCGFIFIDCISNGTHIKQWVFEANNTLCPEATTASPTEGVETYCDSRQDGAQCYGALGGTVVLQLMDSASEISIYQLYKNTAVILNGRKNRIMSIADRSSFTPSDGTFRINKLSRTDGGEYTLTIFDSKGRRSEPRTLQLTIQAPVSSVLLVSECLSQGEMRVSCSSEGGDSPQYSWTLDGHTLTDTQLLSGNNETNNITLKQDVSGQLACSVKNHVSRIATCGFRSIDCTSSNGMHISQRIHVTNTPLCIEPSATSRTTSEDRSLLICGLRAAVVILILIGIVVFFAWKKKKNEKIEGSSVRRRIEDQENSVMMVEMRS